LTNKHPQHKKKVHDKEFGNSGNDVESFGEGGEAFRRVQGLPDILGGSVSECIFLRRMKEYYEDQSTGPAEERSKIKDFYDKLVAFFTLNSDVKMRLKYYAYQSYSAFTLNPALGKHVLTMKINGSNSEEWGKGYDVSYSEGLCTNFGCGNSTGRGIKFPSMSDRCRLITPDSKNKTYFMNSVYKVVLQNGPASPVALQYRAYNSSLIYCIHDQRPQPCQCSSPNPPPSNSLCDNCGCRIQCLSKVLTDMASNVRNVLIKAGISTWYGEETTSESQTASFGTFCGC
jgi:hypothetical protein